MDTKPDFTPVPGTPPHDVTIPIPHLEKIFAEKQIKKEKVLNSFGKSSNDIFEFKKLFPPKIKVSFFRTEKSESAGVETKSKEILSIPVNKHSVVEVVLTDSGKYASYQQLPIQSQYLWDLSSFDQVDILRLGRFKDNDFLPVISDQPYALDLGVSRQHAFIAYHHQQLFYVDLGTSTKFKFKDSKQAKQERTHFGSKNGSWLYEQSKISKCIQNECILWLPGTMIGMGTFFHHAKIGEKEYELLHQFTLVFEELEQT